VAGIKGEVRCMAVRGRGGFPRGGPASAAITCLATRIVTVVPADDALARRRLFSLLRGQ